MTEIKEQKQIMIIPIIGLRAFTTNFFVKKADEENPKAVLHSYGGAWRVWTVLRHLDQETGSGIVCEHCCEAWAIKHNIPPRRWRRWMQAAIDAKWIRSYSRNRSGIKTVVYGYCRPAVVANTVGCQYIETQMVNMDLDLFAALDPAKYIWAAYLSTLPKTPISRLKMRELTGVAENTQYKYERELGIRSIRNFAVTDLKPAHIKMIREFAGTHYFVLIDPHTRQQYVARRLPDTRIVSLRGIDPVYRKYLARRINRELKGNGMVKRVKLFHGDHKTLERAQRKLGRLSARNEVHARPEHLFEQRQVERGPRNPGPTSTFWDEKLV